MLKLTRETNGYFFEKLNGETVHIFKIDRKTWVWSIDHSMTKGTFTSLKSAKQYFEGNV